MITAGEGRCKLEKGKYPEPVGTGVAAGAATASFRASADRAAPASSPGMFTGIKPAVFLVLALVLASLAGCASTAPMPDVYHDPAMDFAAIRRVAVLPFVNLAQDPRGAERVRDVVANALLATEAFYVLPSGEVFRGINRAGLINRAAPSPEEIVRFAGVVKADAVITGVVREYGEVRSGSISANTISLSLSMLEGQTGTVVWSATSTKGGINTWIRLFGGGGKPMNEVTRDAVEDLLDSLFM